MDKGDGDKVLSSDSSSSHSDSDPSLSSSEEDEDGDKAIVNAMFESRDVAAGLGGINAEFYIKGVKATLIKSGVMEDKGVTRAFILIKRENKANERKWCNSATVVAAVADVTAAALLATAAANTAAKGASASWEDGGAAAKCE